MKSLTHYEVLQLPPAASQEALHTRYLELAYALRRVVAHPAGDAKYPKEAARFRALTAAWGELRQARTRALYDKRLAVEGRICGVCRGTGKGYRSKCQECEGSGLR